LRIIEGIGRLFELSGHVD